MTDAEKIESIELLKDLLSIPSVNSSSREADVAEYLQRYFQGYGIQSEIQYIDDQRANIIADFEGENSEVLHIWNGHIDTVPYGNVAEWSTDPAQPAAIEGKIFARGASDMKSGLAAMVYTLCAMAKAQTKPQYNIRFIGTCDEEKGGDGARKIIEDNRFGNPSFMLIGEPTDCNIGIAQKGCLWIKLVVHGKTSHGAYPEQGVNAVEYGVDICRKFRQEITQHVHPLLKAPTAEITSVNGGIAPNMIPDMCELIMDVRIVPGLLIDDVLGMLRRICDEFQDDNEDRLSAEFTVLNYRAAINTNPDNDYVEQLKGLIEQHGLKPELLGINYFTDASVLVSEGSDLPVLLFGPGTPDTAHKPNEYIEITNYYTSIEILKELLSSIPSDCVII